MDSQLPAIVFLTLVLCTFSFAHSSTIGVGYISRILEIQDRERAPPSVQVAAARAVLHRLLPSHSSSFDFQIVSNVFGAMWWCEYCFMIRNHPSFSRRVDPEILIMGVTGVEISAGLHCYLKHWCGSHISWDNTGGAQLFSVPRTGLLPRVQDAGILVQRPIPWNYYQNAVTSSFLPAFSGNVPAALKYIFPSAKMTRLGNWFSVKSDPKLCCTYLLDATDPLFIDIGRAFIKEQLKEYGSTGHIYNCDTFDENTPPVDDPEYISSLGAAIFRGMQSGDDNAVWLMQGWLFSYDPFWRPPQMKALLQSVPVGRLVVLDLFAEVKPIWITSEQFYGVPYIWCMLHNFAGNVEMYGILDSIASGPVDARKSENSTMVGVGMSMEGIEQNPVVYDVMSEMAFQHNKVDVESWIHLYSKRCHGQSVPLIQDAWNILHHTVYNCTDGAYDKNRDIIVSIPDVDPSLISVPHERYNHQGKSVSRRAAIEEITDSFDQPHLWYSTSEVIHALELFISSGDELSESNSYRYTHLSIYFLLSFLSPHIHLHGPLCLGMTLLTYQLNDVHGVTCHSQKFLELVEDMDALLACHDGFLLGPWLESAKKTQITMWFDNSEEEASLLRDYDYHGPRAAIYFNFLIESLEKGHDFQLKDWRREWIKLTNDWQRSRKAFPVESTGNALNTSRWLYNKYLRSPDT
ncbi:alpha-N-acetylglucosaminidase-like isoform X1 [Fagus crenata]